MYEEMLRENLPKVEERIEAARRRGGWTSAVELVAVTKGHPPEAVEAALAHGLHRCGENRVQELVGKAERFGVEAVEWHMIGHLQRNKVARALDYVQLIHSVDSLRLAEAISREAVKRERAVPVLVQVNASGEESKGGFAVEAGRAGVEAVVALPGLRVQGLMTMAPWTTDEAVIRRVFRRTRELFEECAAEVAGFEAVHLSMGMSNDYEVAVEEGSTMVRLGTVLFGERPR